MEEVIMNILSISFLFLVFAYPTISYLRKNNWDFKSIRFESRTLTDKERKEMDDMFDEHDPAAKNFSAGNIFSDHIFGDI